MKQVLCPEYDESFTPQKYIGLFDFVSVDVTYNFSSTLEYVEITHVFLARKAQSGPSGWCSYFDMASQDCLHYYDEDGKEIPSRLIEDRSKHHYFLADFPKRLNKGDAITFKIVTRQNVEKGLQQDGDANRMTLFISRVYGSSCDDFELAVKVPSSYSLAESIPGLVRTRDSFRLRTQIKKLQPVQLAIVLKKRRWPQLRDFIKRRRIELLLGILFAVLSAVLGWYFTVYWTP